MKSNWMMVALFVSATNVAAEQVYRCESEDGSIAFSDAPCEAKEKQSSEHYSSDTNILESDETAREQNRPVSNRANGSDRSVSSSRESGAAEGSNSCGRFQILSARSKTKRESQPGVMAGGTNSGEVVSGAGTVVSGPNAGEPAGRGGGVRVGGETIVKKCSVIRGEWTSHEGPLRDDDLASELASQIQGYSSRGRRHGSASEATFASDGRLNSGDSFRMTACWGEQTEKISQVECR